jgi:flagellar hook-basal body complex protein FliE
MSDLRIGGVGGAAGTPSLQPAGRTGRGDGVGFGDALRQALGEVNQLQQSADHAAQAFSLGQTRDVASTLITIEKANIGFQLALQIRNKLVEAYQEIMRTPI